MEIQQQGILKKWQDDRGFGFIQPDNGQKEVFIHISDIKRASRRPRVGDRLIYVLVLESNGKLRASNASIYGVLPPATPSNHRSTRTESRYPPRQTSPRKTNRWGQILGSLLTLGGIGFAIVQISSGRISLPVSSLLNPNCKIKGNISISSGNKLYHLPGMEDYETTRIDPLEGEKMFCSESEAITQGWRKAPR